jgi:cytochrome c peroxidase
MKARLTIFLSAFVLLFSCREKEDGPLTPPAAVYHPTPYQVQYPGWVDIFAGPMPVPNDNPTTLEGVELGRRLFFDKRLSDDMTMSCGSCHKQENGFSDPRAFSIGTDGSAGDRNAMAIINLAWSKGLFWDGRRSSLEEQAHDPVTNMIEMRNTWPQVVKRLQNDPKYPSQFFSAFGTRKIDSNLVVKAIAQFERTLVSFNSRFDNYYYEGDSNALSDSEKRGLQLYMSNRTECYHCHTDPLMTDNAYRNNGLDNFFIDLGRSKFTGLATDKGKFRVPTLRNIALTAPYMHDSRFTTLEQVIDQYDHGVQSQSPNLDENIGNLKDGLNLTVQERTDLLAFLRTLTDSSFIMNPAFLAP